MLLGTISSESASNYTDSELIFQICDVVYRMLTNNEWFYSSNMLIVMETGKLINKMIY